MTEKNKQENYRCSFCGCEEDTRGDGRGMRLCFSCGELQEEMWHKKSRPEIVELPKELERITPALMGKTFEDATLNDDRKIVLPKADETPISVSEKLVKEDIRKLTQNSEEIKKLKEQVDKKKGDSGN